MARAASTESFPADLLSSLPSLHGCYSDREQDIRPHAGVDDAEASKANEIKMTVLKHADQIKSLSVSEIIPPLLASLSIVNSASASSASEPPSPSELRKFGVIDDLNDVTPPLHFETWTSRSRLGSSFAGPDKVEDGMSGMLLVWLASKLLIQLPGRSINRSKRVG
ncbi:hypothetical protein ACFX2F_006446 [Malus domestica]